MKLKYPWLLLLFALAITSCSSEAPETHYSDKMFIQFSDTAYQMPVTENGQVFEIPVVVSKASSVDRNVIVDVDLKKTNATEGYHFTLESRNITIPAGKMKGSVRIRSNYSHLSPSDSLAFTLYIVNNEDSHLPIYSRETNVSLHKILPFNIDDYVGDVLLTCTFPFSTSSVTTFLTRSEKIDDHTLKVIAPFEQSRNIELRFHDNKENPFDRSIDMRTQVAFTDVTYGKVSMCSIDDAPSYYIPEERAFVLYLLAELEHVGSFGSFFYIFQWITPDEAIARKNGLQTLY